MKAEGRKNMQKETNEKEKWNVCEHCDPYISNDGTCDNCRFE